MESKQAIIKKWKMHLWGLLVIILVQGAAFPLLNALLKEFAGQGSIRKIVLFIVTGICIMTDLYYLFNRVILLRQLLNRQPVKCRLEDILLIGYREDNRTRYSPFLIVRSLQDHKLYLTYDKYSLVGFNAIFNYSNREKILCTVYKGNGNPIRLGDIVNMYILKTLYIPVSINKSKNTVKLNHKKFYFRHMNDQLDIDVFRSLVFFKGAIDLD